MIAALPGRIARRGRVMIAPLTARIERNRKFLPLSTTIGLFVIACSLGALMYSGMRDGQVYLNLFNATPFFLLCAVGETLVIISGGIDLSVGGLVALTTVGAAALLQQGWNPWVVIMLMLVMGMTFGLVMGVFITYLKVQPFIATLAGMWLARGLCYVISDNEIRIYDPVWKLLSGTHILIPGLSDPSTKTGDYITIMVVVAVAILAVGMYLAHYTRFGRTVYAMGSNNGAGEQSARLMGLPVNRTKVLVYVFSGFCSALAGIAYSVYAHSGHGTHATNMELTVIAAVVIGGTALTGGEGYLLGSLFGVLITELIQSLIRADGRISAWWTYILIGGLMLFFIGIQSLLAAWNANALGKQRAAGSRIWVAAGPRTRKQWWQRKRTLVKIGVAGLVVAVVATGGYFVLSPKAAVTCTRPPLRQDQAEQLRAGGAVIVYERNGGNTCVDELYAIYSDGRITADDGKTIKEEKTTADKVSGLLTDIDNYRWFTQDFYSTPYDPCAACFTYYLTVTYKGQVKTVHAVDGDAATPAAFWLITSALDASIRDSASSQPQQ